MYECQVSTQPVRSFFVRLNILGEPSILRKQKSIHFLYLITECYSIFLFNAVIGRALEINKIRFPPTNVEINL